MIPIFRSGLAFTYSTIFFGLPGSRVFIIGPVILDLHKDQGIFRLDPAFYIQPVVIIFHVIELNDLLAAAVMMAEKDLVTDGIIGKECLVYGIFAVIIFIRNHIPFFLRCHCPFYPEGSPDLAAGDLPPALNSPL